MSTCEERKCYSCIRKAENERLIQKSIPNGKPTTDDITRLFSRSIPNGKPTASDLLRLFGCRRCVP